MKNKLSHPGVLVDYEKMFNEPVLERCVKRLSEKLAIVLVVSDPDVMDYEDGEFGSGFEPDVVIRNPKGLTELKLYQQILNILTDFSSIEPIIALVGDSDVKEFLRDDGVPIVADSWGEWL